MENNKIIKIISWNVNQFCMQESWKELGNKITKFQSDNFNLIINEINRLDKIIGDNGVLILQEVPPGYRDKLKNEIKNKSIEFGNDSNCDANFYTVAIYNDAIYSECKYNNIVIDKKHYYENRCVLLNHKVYGIKVLGIHNPVSTSAFWISIGEFMSNEDKSIIIGDFNVSDDKETNNYDFYHYYLTKYKFIEPILCCENDEVIFTDINKKVPATYCRGKTKTHIDRAILKEGIFNNPKYIVLQDK